MSSQYLENSANEMRQIWLNLSQDVSNNLLSLCHKVNNMRMGRRGFK